MESDPLGKQGEGKGALHHREVSANARALAETEGHVALAWSLAGNRRACTKERDKASETSTAGLTRQALRVVPMYR